MGAKTGRAKYRRVTELFIRGSELILDDGKGGAIPMWIQVLNPFEMDEARSDAQAARARLTLALKDRDSDESVKLRASFWSKGRDEAVSHLVDSKLSSEMSNIIESIRNDPDWTERLEIADRADDDAAGAGSTPEERELVSKINRDYVVEVNERFNAEREFLEKRYADWSEEDLKAEYEAWYIETRAGDLAISEYQTTEMWYACRVCDAEPASDGWNHDACDHSELVYGSKSEVRQIPMELATLIVDKIQALNMTVREAKNADRQGSSSGSSPLPSEEGESTPSTPTATPPEPRGTSPQPSATH